MRSRRRPPRPAARLRRTRHHKFSLARQPMERPRDFLPIRKNWHRGRRAARPGRLQPAGSAIAESPGHGTCCAARYMSNSVTAKPAALRRARRRRNLARACLFVMAAMQFLVLDRPGNCGSLWNSEGVAAGATGRRRRRPRTCGSFATFATAGHYGTVRVAGAEYRRKIIFTGSARETRLRRCNGSAQTEFDGSLQLLSAV